MSQMGLTDQFRFTNDPDELSFTYFCSLDSPQAVQYVLDLVSECRLDADINVQPIGFKTYLFGINGFAKTNDIDLGQLRQDLDNYTTKNLGES